MEREKNGSKFQARQTNNIIVYEDYALWYEDDCEEVGNSVIIAHDYELIEDEEIDIRELKETELKKDGRLEYFEYENNGTTESGYSKNYCTCDIETRKIMNGIIRVVKQHEKEIKELKEKK